MKFTFFALFLSLTLANAHSSVSCYSNVDEQLVVGLEFDPEKLVAQDQVEGKLNYNKVNSYTSPTDIYYQYNVTLGKSRKITKTTQFEILEVDANRLPRSVEKFVDNVKFSAEVSNQVNLSGKLPGQKFDFDCHSIK